MKPSYEYLELLVIQKEKDLADSIVIRNFAVNLLQEQKVVIETLKDRNHYAKWVAFLSGAMLSMALMHLLKVVV